MLKTKKDKIINSTDGEVRLRGLNVGGWLMMEGYILHSPNRPVKLFKADFAKHLGKKTLLEFEDSFNSTFIRESDFANIASWGLNCVRLPFHYNLFEKTPGNPRPKGFPIFDLVIQWAKKHNIYLILDLHAVVGCQNCDWHSDSDCKMEVWTNKNYQKRTLEVWERIADKYKNEKIIAGYDLINESTTPDAKILNKFYKDIIKTIRASGDKHILFIEGNTWATNIECLEEFKDDNYALSIHNYDPLNFTFNFIPHLKYPLEAEGMFWNKETTYAHLSKYKKIAQERQLPVFVGEFGVNYREGLYGEIDWLKDTLSVYEELGFSWTYWTYKAIKYHMFPDGVLSYYGNPPWVNRIGPKTGWETFVSLWKDKKQVIIDSWKTDNFHPNQLLIETLKQYAK